MSNIIKNIVNTNVITGFKKMPRGLRIIIYTVICLVIVAVAVVFGVNVI